MGECWDGMWEYLKRIAARQPREPLRFSEYDYGYPRPDTAHHDEGGEG